MSLNMTAKSAVLYSWPMFLYKRSLEILRNQGKCKKQTTKANLIHEVGLLLHHRHLLHLSLAPEAGLKLNKYLLISRLIFFCPVLFPVFVVTLCSVT